MLKKVAVSALVAASVVGFTGSAQAATSGPVIPRSLFGMHLPTITSGDYPAEITPGSVRLWDTGTAWRDIELTRGVYTWGPMDRAVDTARAHGATVMLVIGAGTPAFYQKTHNPSIYGIGYSSAANDLGAWRNYITALATRYKGRIGAYEPINEADITSFWTGTDAELVTQSRIAYQTINAIDPHAIVTSPSFVDRLSGSQYRIVNYLTKTGGCKWSEAISYHPYGQPVTTAEKNADLIITLRQKLRALGCTKPIWSTEINVGLQGGDVKPDAALISPDYQASIIFKTYPLQWSAGARRVYWYDWSDAPFLGVTKGPEVAKAFQYVQKVMAGQFLGCNRVKDLYTCTIKYGRYRYGIIRWAGSDFTTFSLPRHSIAMYDMYGSQISRHSRINVGTSPVVIKVRSL
jgi:polysaccharide biosynthesis protein PslG